LLNYAAISTPWNRSSASLLVIVLIGLLADKILFSPWERFLHRGGER